MYYVKLKICVIVIHIFTTLEKILFYQIYYNIKIQYSIQDSVKFIYVYAIFFTCRKMQI